MKENFTFDPPRHSTTVYSRKDNIDFVVTGWFDDFTKANSGWDILSYPDGSYQKFDFGDYEIRVNSPNGPSSVSTYAPVAVPLNRKYTVTAKMYEDSGQGMYGLIFNVRELSKGNYYHIFRVNPQDQSFELIQASKPIQGVAVTETIDSGFSSRIHTEPKVVNELSVKQDGAWVELSINQGVVSAGSIEPQWVGGVKAGLYVWANYKESYQTRFVDFRISAEHFETGFTHYGFSSAQFNGAEEYSGAKSDKSIELRQ